MAKLCKKYGVVATYAMPSIHQNEDVLRVSDEEIRKFWRLYLRMKKEGAPFIQTDVSINTIINWPYPYFKILKKEDILPGKEVRKCAMKDKLILIGGEGELYPCTVKYHQKGLNAKDVGVRKAFESLRKTDDCYACSDLSCINLSYVTSLDPRVLFEVVGSYFRMFMR
jgi:hypothetical protein